MAHRSNQAVASQEQPAPQPAPDPSPGRRFLIGWATALAALAVSTGMLAGALWLARLSIAELLIDAALAERGLEADFAVTRLDLGAATITDLRIGAASEPDIAIDAIAANWRWAGVMPRLEGVQVLRPRVRMRIDPQGRISAGVLDQVRGGQSRRRLAIPAINLEIEEGEALIEAPFGALTASFHGAGRIGEDFSAFARIAPTTQQSGAYALRGGTAELTILSRDEAIAMRLDAAFESMTWNDLKVDAAALRAMARAPLDLGFANGELAWRAASIRAPQIDARIASGVLGAEAVMHADALSPETWAAHARVNAGEFTLAENAMTAARFTARAEGRDTRGQASWTLGGERFEGLGLASNTPSANGALTLDFGAEASARGDARFLLAASRLDNATQAQIRSALPDLPQAPVGPTFARAEAALDDAADRFDLTIPLTLAATREGAAITLTSAAEARAANGVILRLAPLREDAPALRLQIPDMTLAGSIALELNGGGAPNVSALLDTLGWTPQTQFDADGTLSISDWRAGGASIAAEELGLTIAIAQNGHGAVDLRGPLRVTGPLGDGEVRDLVADLDITAQWSQGWRIVPNRGCVATRLGGLDAAGLSFADGRFALCALDGALIAADARGRLSGGFAIQQLSVGGRMAGPEAQPARVSADRVTGRFSGVQGNLLLSMEAQRPLLRVELTPERTLTLLMRRLTAQAHIADTWRVEGAFEQGALSEPALPGTISAIAGRWSAAPENDLPVIRVEAGEALLEAIEPESNAEQPLFHALRLSEAQAVFRDGQINASGAILRNETAQTLARFEAEHDVAEGEGRARVLADDLRFDQSLQPYDITELARGLVDNVRGEIDASAEFAWARDHMSSGARVDLNGVSLSTATIPDVRNVRGTIVFDDLVTLTTPPGQEVTIGSLNPGVEVQNGRVRFQLRESGVVSVERAEFEFASGVLAMAPTTITLGADETEFTLTLTDVDAADLIANLNIQDLAVTGRVEGSFPLLLTRRAALIRNGQLRTVGDGGTIAYTGAAGESAVGPARVAFDALRDFRYTGLTLTLNGDLSGDVVSDIAFTGENSGGPVDLGPIAPIPGIGRVTVYGVPFVFNVRVSAPFRRLADTAASLVDPGALIGRTQEPVDRPAPPTE